VLLGCRAIYFQAYLLDLGSELLASAGPQTGDCGALVKAGVGVQLASREHLSNERISAITVDGAGYGMVRSVIRRLRLPLPRPYDPVHAARSDATKGMTSAVSPPAGSAPPRNAGSYTVEVIPSPRGPLAIYHFAFENRRERRLLVLKLDLTAPRSVMKSGRRSALTEYFQTGICLFRPLREGSLLLCRVSVFGKKIIHKKHGFVNKTSR